MMMYEYVPRPQYNSYLLPCVVQVSVILVRWSVICCQEWGCTRLLVRKSGHTGLVPFVDELGTVCSEVPLEYGFEVIV